VSDQKLSVRLRSILKVAAHKNIPALAEALTNIRKRLVDQFPEFSLADSFSVPPTMPHLR